MVFLSISRHFLKMYLSVSVCILVCACVCAHACVCVCVRVLECHLCRGPCGGQKEALDPQELELLAVLTKLRSSGKSSDHS